MGYKEDAMGKVKNYIALLQIMIILSLRFQVMEWRVWRSEEALDHEQLCSEK